MARRRRPPSRRGLHALLWGGLFFALAQLALGLAAQHDPRLRDPEYGERWARLHSRLAAEPDRPLLLVLGSSRVMTGFRPDVLPRYRTAAGQAPLLFNYGFQGFGPVRELLALRRLLAEGVRPRWLVVECWPCLMDQSMGDTEADREEAARLSWDDLPVLRGHTPRPGNLYGRWCRAWLVPCFTNRFPLLARYAPELLPPRHLWLGARTDIDPSGWMPQPLPTSRQWFQEYLNRICREFPDRLKHFRRSARSDRALREILDVCRQEGIQVALLLMPEAESFRGWYPPAVGAGLDRYWAELRREYGVRVIDARAWVAGAGFLGDGIHLLPRGAATFTRRFGREVLRQLVAADSLPPFLLAAGKGSEAKPPSEAE